MQWPPIYVVWWKKMWRCSKYPSLYTRQINYKKNIKTECLRREGYVSLMCSAYPPKPLVIPWCMRVPMGDVITHAQFQLNRFRGQGATVTPNSLFPIHSDHDPYPLYTVISLCDCVQIPNMLLRRPTKYHQNRMIFRWDMATWRFSRCPRFNFRVQEWILWKAHVGLPIGRQ